MCKIVIWASKTFFKLQSQAAWKYWNVIFHLFLQ